MKILYPEFSREEIISLLKRRSKYLSKKLPLVCVVLFGSYATKRQTAASDVDILVVYRGPGKEKDYGIVWDAFNIPVLEPHVYTLSDYSKIIKEDASLPREVQKTGIVIYGKPPLR